MRCLTRMTIMKTMTKMVDNIMLWKLSLPFCILNELLIPQLVILPSTLLTHLSHHGQQSVRHFLSVLISTVDIASGVTSSLHLKRKSDSFCQNRYLSIDQKFTDHLKGNISWAHLFPREQSRLDNRLERSNIRSAMNCDRIALFEKIVCTTDVHWRVIQVNTVPWQRGSSCLLQRMLLPPTSGWKCIVSSSSHLPCCLP